MIRRRRERECPTCFRRHFEALVVCSTCRATRRDNPRGKRPFRFTPPNQQPDREEEP